MTSSVQNPAMESFAAPSGYEGVTALIFRLISSHLRSLDNDVVVDDELPKDLDDLRRLISDFELLSSFVDINKLKSVISFSEEKSKPRLSFIDRVEKKFSYEESEREANS